MGGSKSKPAARRASAMDVAAKYEEDTDEVVMDPNGLPEGCVFACSALFTSLPAPFACNVYPPLLCARLQSASAPPAAAVWTQNYRQTCTLFPRITITQCIWMEHTHNGCGAALIRIIKTARSFSTRDTCCTGDDLRGCFCARPHPRLTCALATQGVVCLRSKFFKKNPCVLATDAPCECCVPCGPRVPSTPRACS